MVPVELLYVQTDSRDLVLLVEPSPRAPALVLAAVDSWGKAGAPIVITAVLLQARWEFCIGI